MAHSSVCIRLVSLSVTLGPLRGRTWKWAPGLSHEICSLWFSADVVCCESGCDFYLFPLVSFSLAYCFLDMLPFSVRVLSLCSPSFSFIQGFLFYLSPGQQLIPHFSQGVHRYLRLKSWRSFLSPFNSPAP